MKRIIAIAVSLALVLGTFGSIGVAAVNNPTMTVESVSGEVGQTVSVNVVLANNPGLSAASVKISYDEARLTLVSATLGSQYSTGAYVNYNLPYIAFARPNNVEEDGIFLTLSFTIKSMDGNGSVTIEYVAGDITDIDENDVTFDVVPGTVSVECHHTDKTEVPSKSADCVHPGNHLYYTCGSCGVILKADGITETTVEAETIPALGHDLSAATCTEAAKCQREGCGHVEGSALGHSFTNYVSNGDATCTDNGTKTAKCDRCDETHTVADPDTAKGHDYDDATCTTPKTCKACGTTEGEAQGHSFTNYVSNRDATCTEDGTKTAKCDRCDMTNTVADPDTAKGHDYDDATCTTPKTCKVCGATQGEALGHSFTNYVSNNDATCTADGTKTAKCDRCDVTDTVTEVGSIKAHDYADATCTKPKTCKVCGATEGIALGHSYASAWSKGEEGHWHECAACGDKADLAAHDYGTEGDTCHVCEYQRQHVHRLTLVPAVDASCTTGGSKAYYTCSGCEDWFEDASGSVVISDKTFVVITALGHDMMEATCTEAAHCRREGCDHVEGAALGHSFTNYVSNGDATCTADGTKTAKCDRCNATDTIADPDSAKGHDYDDATCTAPKTCKVCGATEGIALGHSYASIWSKGETGHWHECAACGDKADLAAHDYGTEGDTCLVCEYRRNHVHRLTLVPAAAASCTTCGSKAYYTCSGCEDWFEDASGSVVISDKTSVVITALGHDMMEATCTEAAKCRREDCGYTEGSARGHSYEESWIYDAEGHWHKCSRCDAKTDKEAHIPGAEATENTAQTCMVCGYEIAAALEHTHKLTKVDATVTCTEAGNKAYYTCECGKWFADAAAAVEITNHDSVISPALGHTDANNDHICDLCSEKLEADQPTAPDPDGNPQTGDSGNAAVWAVLMILSFAGILVCVLLNKRRNMA